MNTNTQYLTPSEFAHRHGIDPAQLREWIRRGHLPVVRLGRDRLIPEDALERLLPRAHQKPRREEVGA